MAGLVSSVGSILRLIGDVEDEGYGKGLLKAVNSKEVQLMRADGSMFKLLGKYIVEPVAVVTKDLKDLEELDSILGLHMDMFTGYYMQVFDILIEHYGLNVRTVVDTLTTDNGGLTRVALMGAAIALESDDNEDYLGNLIKLGSLDIFTLENLSVEADRKTTDKKYGAPDRDMSSTPVSLADRKDFLIPNAIQRTIQITTEVPIQSESNDGTYHTRTIIIPVTIKLAVIFTDVDNIINAISTKSDKYGFSERLDEYRAGAISLTDFVFASDIINKYKHNKLKDKDQLLELLHSRELSANSKIVTNGFVGFEKFYNMYIISSDARVAIEQEVKGKLGSKGKDKFLERGNGLSITTLDTDYERIQIMLKDIRGKTDLSFKNAVKKDKNGSDYSEIIKALMANKPPAF